jgi:aspartate oxidase
MWDNVGVVRNSRGLEIALEDLNDIRAEANKLHRMSPTLETAGVRDAAFAGLAVAEAAIANRESRGAHCIVEPAEDSDEEEQQLAAAR